ncbi:MAG TPA: glycine--tRNA ligase subunit beta [Anaerolineae bacterium]|nr:glycine--tRNA ligase subunit beta [Anaerolineae bacterium]
MAEKPWSFQDVIMRLERFWADHGCIIWQPHSEKVGAGTMNPATVLRVLGPEPWNVAYVEPSYRPDDGRYGENPNRMQMHTQYQVILKPDPGNPQELYLDSLEAIGIDRRQHDIRFVEDNWESPALGAWGLGWEVWLDGLEITQFTYFQQAGGIDLDPVSVELTYGLERIVMFLQGVKQVWDIDWDGQHTYGELLLPQEIEYCQYQFDHADVDRLRRIYDLYEAEALNAIAHRLVIPAHDYVLRCSHTFNVLDARGAVGVTERARFFARMRDLARQVAELYTEQRQRLEYPWLDTRYSLLVARGSRGEQVLGEGPSVREAQEGPADFLLEIGTEELPAADVRSAIEQLRRIVPAALSEARLDYKELRVTGTPRRLVVYVTALADQQRDEERTVKGPPVRVAFDARGNPTRAAEGFARKQGVRVADLVRREVDGGEYVFAIKVEEGRPTTEILPSLLPDLIAQLQFDKTMRWDSDGVAFSRPIRWLVALFGRQVIPFSYAKAESGRVSRGLRPLHSPQIRIPQAGDYFRLMAQNQVLIDREERRASVQQQVEALATEVGGVVPDDPALLDEVTDLVEQPVALRGSFDPRYLALPKDVLITVMKKHQRYFPVVHKPTDDDGAGDERLLPYFIAVANGEPRNPDVVRAGNEAVLRARYADADFFYKQDTARPLGAFNPRLATLTFQEQLGSMLDKVIRVEQLASWLAEQLGLSDDEKAAAQRAAQLCKADLATSMVIELTSLQGIMGREYARLSGEPEAVAEAIFEHYLPRFAGDRLPRTMPGLVVGLANRLDSIAGLFAVGMVPTGSSDPYGLRRDALGLVLTLVDAQRSFSLQEGLERAARLQPIPVSAEALADALAFIVRRLHGWLREQGLRYDVVDAAVAARGDNPYMAYQAAVGLNELVAAPDWQDVLNAYARCVRIVRGIEEHYKLSPENFVEPATERLYEAYLLARAEVTPESDVEVLGEVLRQLVDPINQFFDQVLVMTEDETLRTARLGLLQHIAALTDGIVDLSKLQGF